MTRGCCGRRHNCKVEVANCKSAIEASSKRSFRSFFLAVGAKKRRALSLDNADDCCVAGHAWLSGAVIDAVVVLVAARLVQSVAIGAIGEG